MAVRVAHRPTYSFDEVTLGVLAAFLLHIAIVAPLVYRKLHPGAPTAEEQPLVAKPVIAATLLKLGKPLDPKKLPDRIVPQHNTAPKKEVIASREDPKVTKDAGAPPPIADDSDIRRLAAKNDPFPEDAGRPASDVGAQNGSDAGMETDPNKVHAGDQYAALLGKFFHDRWQFPTVISQGEANHLCTVMQVTFTPRMVIWHLKQEPVRKSGNDLFDDSAREMLQKLLDDRTPLPEPPAEVAEQFKGRTVNVALSGDLHGDSSRCK